VVVEDIELAEMLQTMRIPNNWMEKTIDLLTDRTVRAARVLLVTAPKLKMIQAGMTLLGRHETQEKDETDDTQTSKLAYLTPLPNKPIALINAHLTSVLACWQVLVLAFSACFR